MKFNEEIFKTHAEFCSLFSSIVRMKIFWIIRESESTVSEIAEKIEVSVQNVSQHLRIMRDKGAVAIRKDGKQVYYRVANDKFTQGAKLIREGVIEEIQKKSGKMDV